MPTKSKDFISFDAHFSGEIDSNLSDFVKDCCLVHSRYLFVHRIHPKFSIQSGYCTHCKSIKTIESSKPLKHNSFWQCSVCKSSLTVKNAGFGRGKMIDRAYVIWYEKSLQDKDAIVCTGYKVVRDYTDSIDIETKFYPVMRCVFKIGSAVMALRDHYSTGFFANRRIHYKDGWKFAANPYTLMGKHYFTSSSFQSVESMKEAVKETPFTYSEWGMYLKKNMDMVDFFAAFSKYPFIEYLIKMDMKEIADKIIRKEPMYGALNLRGKSMVSILGLSKKELKDWKATGIKMSADILSVYKWFRKQGIPVSWQTTSRCEGLNGDRYKDTMDDLSNHTTIARMISYAESQIRKYSKHFTSVTSVLADWRDYIKECKTLQMDLTDDRFLFPNNLHAAHQKNRASIKLKKNPEIDTAIVSQQLKLQKFSYTAGDFMIRPIANLTELFDEGGELVHCVGGYADRYAEGIVAIFAIRRVTEPDKPFFTLELLMKSLAVAQCRGFENCTMNEEVRFFVNDFVARKLLTRKRKIDTTGIMPERQEAVV